MPRLSYDTDLTDYQWQILESLISSTKTGSRNRFPSTGSVDSQSVKTSMVGAKIVFEGREKNYFGRYDGVRTRFVRSFMERKDEIIKE